MTKIPKILREFYLRSGLTSYRSVAKRAGYRGESSIQRYFSDQDYTADTIHPKIAAKFATAFNGLGEPSITYQEVVNALVGQAGPTISAVSKDIIDIAETMTSEEQSELLRFACYLRDSGRSA